MINKVVLLGRIANIPKSNHHNKNATLCSTFSLAVDRGYKPKDEKAQTADFLYCKAFAKTAANIIEYCTKGDTVCITGQIHSNRYEKNGETMYFTEIVVENIKFLPNFGVIKTGDVLPKTPDEIWSEMSQAEKTHALVIAKEQMLRNIANEKKKEQKAEVISASDSEAFVSQLGSAVIKLEKGKAPEVEAVIAEEERVKTETASAQEEKTEDKDKAEVTAF